MKRLSFVLLVLFAFVLGLSNVASAANDHLKCYKVKDPLMLKGPMPSWLDLTGPQFGTEQCSIVGAYRLFCVPVTKTVTQPIQRKFGKPGSVFQPVPPKQAFQNFTPDPFTGEALAEDKMCYKLKCTNPAPIPPNPGQTVTDQFGSRKLSNLHPFLLCGPAVKGTQFTFTMDQGQETPPTGSAATGACTAILNDAQTALTISCTHNVAGVFAAHIHLGAPGVPGGIVHGFPSPVSPINDVWDGTDVPPLTPADVANLLNGQLYVNVHSFTFGGGEIRGQIVP